MTYSTGISTTPRLPAHLKTPICQQDLRRIGIHNINNQIYVTYAMQDSPKHDPVSAAGSGMVDVFDVNGNFIKTFASGGTLNAPWGVVATPATFGTFSNAILVGNFGDGTISAFDTSGKFLGQVTDASNKMIVNLGLWTWFLAKAGPAIPTRFTSPQGGSNQTSGLFATLVPAATVTTADFSLTLSAQSAPARDQRHRSCEAYSRRLA